MDIFDGHFADGMTFVAFHDFAMCSMSSNLSLLNSASNCSRVGFSGTIECPFLVAITVNFFADFGKFYIEMLFVVCEIKRSRSKKFPRKKSNNHRKNVAKLSTFNYVTNIIAF